LHPKTTLIHVSSRNDIDHVSKKFFHDVEGWVESAIARLSNDFHVSNVNTNFVLVQEMDIKTS
jgi:hypothetical protein